MGFSVPDKFTAENPMISSYILFSVYIPGISAKYYE